MPKTIFLAAAQPPNGRRASTGEVSVSNTLRYTEVINTKVRTNGKNGISHKLNPGLMEVEKNVTRTVKDFKINNQDEASSETLSSSNPHSFLEDSLASIKAFSHINNHLECSRRQIQQPKGPLGHLGPDKEGLKCFGL